jgi:hypothetical protein
MTVARDKRLAVQCSIAVIGGIGVGALAANFGDISASLGNLLSADAMSDLSFDGLGDIDIGGFFSDFSMPDISMPDLGAGDALASVADGAGDALASVAGGAGDALASVADGAGNALDSVADSAGDMCESCVTCCGLLDEV